MMNYIKMFKPYTKDGHTLEATMRYWKKFATAKGIDFKVMELAITTVFNQIANGRIFPKDECPCGCELDKAATALIHEVDRVMVGIDDDIQIQTVELFQDRYNTIIGDQMRRIAEADEALVKANRPWVVEVVEEEMPIKVEEEVVEVAEVKKLPITERSPILRTIIKVFGRGT